MTVTDTAVSASVRRVAHFIREGNCLPIVSNSLILDQLFGEPGLAAAWAAQVGYPLLAQPTLTAIAQFLSVTQGNSSEQYLDFLKDELLRRERAKAGANQQFLDAAEQQRDRCTFTAFALQQLHLPRLGPPATAEGAPNPLQLLADMPFAAYLTTSPHFFLERALEQVGKAPRPRAYAWYEMNIPEQYAMQPDDKGDPNRPLVYHLFGVDERTYSLVLTEDDHFQFLVSIHDNLRDPRTVSHYFRNAIGSNLLLLLGYSIDGWDLRVFLKGLIKGTTRTELDRRDVAIQIDPTDQLQVSNLESYRTYIRKFFEHVRFDVILQKPDMFISNLHQAL